MGEIETAMILGDKEMSVATDAPQGQVDSGVIWGSIITNFLIF